MAATSSSSTNSKISCYCNKASPLRVAKTESNRGSKFYGCGNFGLKDEKQCNFFQWAGNDDRLKKEEYDFRSYTEERIKELKTEVAEVRKLLEIEMKQKTEFKIKYEILLLKIKFCVVTFCLVSVIYALLK